MDPTLLATIGVALTAIGTALSSAVTYLFLETRRLQKAESNCRQELAEVKAEIWALNARLEQLSWMGDDSPTAQIVVDVSSAVIVEWSPGATILLHWTQREIFGKSMKKIVPSRFHQAVDEAFDRLRQRGGAPKRGPFGVFALTKEGTEIPVEVFLSGWSAGSQRLVGTIIRSRLVEHNGDKSKEPAT